MKPNYLCIGVQKCGTTTIGALLGRHPEIFCNKGELHYFDWYFSSSESQYLARFRTDKTIVGEKSPSYCIFPRALSRIHQFNPHMKLILIVREPISRIWSQWHMVCRNGKPRSKTEAELIEYLRTNTVTAESLRNMNPNNVLGIRRALSEAYIARSRYGEMLNRIWDHFPRKQLHIVVLEELVANPVVEANRITRFLGAKRPYPPDYKLPSRNVAPYSDKPSQAFRQCCYDILRPDIEEFYRLIGRRIPQWDAKHSDLMSQPELPIRAPTPEHNTLDEVEQPNEQEEPFVAETVASVEASPAP